PSPPVRPRYDRSGHAIPGRRPGKTCLDRTHRRMGPMHAATADPTDRRPTAAARPTWFIPAILATDLACARVRPSTPAVSFRRQPRQPRAGPRAAGGTSAASCGGMLKLPLAALAVLAAAAPMAGAAGTPPKKLSLVPGEREPAQSDLPSAAMLGE